MTLRRRRRAAAAAWSIGLGTTGPGGPSGLDPGRHLLLYDGVCGLCGRFVRFVLAHDHRRRFLFAALQGAVGRELVAGLGKDPDRLEAVHVVVDYRSGPDRVLSRSAAALFVLDELGWPWRVATVLGWAPTVLLDWLYDRVAAHRYRLFGRHAACPAPAPEHRERFLDT